MVRITERGFQGSENNTVKRPVEEASLANANGDARSGRGCCKQPAEGLLVHQALRGVEEAETQGIGETKGIIKWF